jgi:hypothetical protein
MDEMKTYDPLNITKYKMNLFGSVLHKSLQGRLEGLNGAAERIDKNFVECHLAKC